MRLVGFAAAVALLIAGLLTWLLLKGSAEKDTAFVQARSTVDAIAVAESRLQRDLIRAQTGLLKTYDPLDAEMKAQQAAALKLEATFPGSVEIRAIVSAMSQQSEYLEQFKSENALLQNSISYFDALSDQLSQPGLSTNLLQAIAALEIRVSELTHGTAGTREDLQARLEALQSLPSVGDARDVASIVAHGRMLLDLMPKVRQLADAVSAATSEPARHAFVDIQRQHRVSRETAAERYRIALYMITLGLLVLLVRVFLLMQNSIGELRRTSAFQFAMARASSRFLEAQTEETQVRIREVLSLISEELGNDRSCVLRLDDPSQSVQWTRPGTTTPADWPDAFRELVPLIAAAPNDTLFLDELESTGQSELHARLVARGLKSWGCARLHQGDDLFGLLCFERMTKPPRWILRSRSLLSLGRDMFIAAIERHRNWQEQRDVEMALRQAQRLEAIGIFASGVAHNINNVLNVMLGHAEIAADALPEKTRVAHQVELMMQAGAHAKEIVSQILDFGRRGRSRQHATSIDAIFTETRAQMNAAAPGSTGIQFDGDAHGSLVYGEPAQLQQILMNLIGNATQASLPGAPIQVGLDHVRIVHPQTFSNGDLKPGDYVRITVADQGRGMDEATRARIFEPFFTTRPAGTGLGLATAFEFVRECGGAFDVQSELGHGSTFAVWLPIVSLQEDPESVLSGPGTLMVVSRTRSAVLEDEEMLAALGFEPVGFADSAAALDALRKAPKRFDLLLVDSKLSDCSGMDFAKRAREIAEGPIVLSLAASDIGDPRTLTSSFVTDVVRRPWRSQSLYSTLSRHLRAGERTTAAVHAPTL